MGSEKKIPLDLNCLFISASVLLMSPLMRAGVDKEGGIVQLLAEVKTMRETKINSFHYLLYPPVFSNPLTGHEMHPHALGRAIGVKLPGTCASLSIPQ